MATWLGDGTAWLRRLWATILARATPMLGTLWVRWQRRDAWWRALRAAIPDQQTRALWSTHVEEWRDVGAVAEALRVLPAVALWSAPAER